MEQELDTLDSLIEQINARWDGKTRGGSYSSEEGDCVFFYNEAVPYFRDRVDSLFTVFRAFEDRRIIGLQIKSVSALPDHDGLRVEVSGIPPVELVRLLLLTFKQQQAPFLAWQVQSYADAAQVLAHATPFAPPAAPAQAAEYAH